MNIAIIGTGAIGLALAEGYAEQQDHQVYIFGRTVLHPSKPNIRWFEIDILNEESIRHAILATEIDTFDRVICCTGMLHTDSVFPEKALKDINLDSLSAIFQVNTFAPMLIAKHFVPKLSAKNHAVFAALSARVGSIDDNRLGGWYAYRASKTALNMLLKTLSIELSRTRPKMVVLGLHPGTVKSALSDPFAKNVKPEKLFTPEYSASKLKTIIEQADPEVSGKIIAWDGVVVPA